MRLTKIKLAGFKSFVDPTSVGFPSNLTGVVGPNGCGKSNIIDAVRWVMGELSAKHLRGDSMADVVFNGSGARKPVGTASVELMFDNGDGRIAGPYAAFNEVSLKRVVARDGSSNYFLNGTRCRRRDITQLFLGTGLGSRSYSIIEQGMISRVIEAKPEDMRAFIEEAAGISRYKERRRETEARVADTRENLERLQDVRDEVDKQIRHLQRQAATARRYQALKEKERRTAAELLALKLRDLDGGAGVHDAALRERELAMQAALADQRAAEASVTRRRTAQESVAQQLAQVQGRHYAIGADISHGEQALQHARELRERQRNDLEGAHRTHAELAAHITRDEQQLIELRAELERIAPELAGAQQLEQAAAAGLAAAEGDLADWQQRWEEWGRAAGAADQRTNVERARMEQLEEQLRGLTARAERLDTEREQLGAVDAGALDGFIAGEAAARARGEALAAALAAAAQQVQELRGALRAAEGALESARAERNRVHEQRVALEALQKAALGADAGSAGEWLRGSGLAGRTRVAERLEVAAGWERAVETALGDYLEAVCVEKLDELAAPLAAFSGGRVVLVEESVAAAGADAPESLASKLVKAPPVVSAQLSQVGTVQSLEQALALRGALAPGRSVITPAGEWVGPGWVRISRGQDRRAGIIEREQQLKALRAQCAACEEAVQGHEQGLGAARRAQQEADAGRDRLQSDIQAAHREHSDARSQLEGARARVQAAAARRDRLEAEIAQVRQETAAAQESLARARAGLAAGQEQLDALLQRRPALEGEREERRAAVAAARAGAQSAQATARDLLVRSESRRSTASSVAVAHERMVEQRAQLAKRRAELAAALEGGDGPIEELRQRLDELLGQRLTVEQELTAARGALEEAEAALRAVEVQRGSAEAREVEAREAMEAARLAAQETRVRREAIAEQFGQTGFDLAEVTSGLAQEAGVVQWEQDLGGLRADIEKLGQVNLAAIDELKEQTERKEYLDRQFTDLTDALNMLEEAMRRIDKETRTRFQETFERINAGLKEKFPRLFGGGHAYLTLVGEDILSAGVEVMARPPGKRNSTIHLLSGGEKALTAVALVFSIFDLNPAPFCLLDEVDAPLDEHNVGRFCDIVREMSQRVQFIFITHNKATMELASQLIGVTMHEPGVSRLVTVDVDEAVRLAAV